MGAIRITPVGTSRQLTSEEVFVSMMTKELGLTGAQARELLSVVNGEMRGEMSLGYSPRLNQAASDLLQILRERFGDRTSVAQLTTEEVRGVLREVRDKELSPQGMFVGILMNQRGFSAADAEILYEIVEGMISNPSSSTTYDDRYRQSVEAIREMWRTTAPEATSVAGLTNSQMRDILSVARLPAVLTEEPSVATPRRTFAYEVTIDGTTYVVNLPHALDPQNKQLQMREALRDQSATVLSSAGQPVDRTRFALDYTRIYNEWQRDRSLHTISITRA